MMRAKPLEPAYSVITKPQIEALRWAALTAKTRRMWSTARLLETLMPEGTVALCTTCGGHGTYRDGDSGTEADGYAPNIVQCECTPAERFPAPAARPGYSEAGVSPDATRAGMHANMLAMQAAGGARDTWEGGEVRLCWCAKCGEGKWPFPVRMILCPNCGNKRCPRSAWHGYKCTGSNEPGQTGEPA
jgi:hypothetical protein